MGVFVPLAPVAFFQMGYFATWALKYTGMGTPKISTAAFPHDLIILPFALYWRLFGISYV